MHSARACAGRGCCPRRRRPATPETDRARTDRRRNEGRAWNARIRVRFGRTILDLEAPDEESSRSVLVACPDRAGAAPSSWRRGAPRFSPAARVQPRALARNTPRPWHHRALATSARFRWQLDFRVRSCPCARWYFWPQELRPYLNVGLVSSNTQDPRRASDLSHMGEITSESKKIPLNSLHDARLHTELPVYLRVA